MSLKILRSSKTCHGPIITAIIVIVVASIVTVASKTYRVIVIVVALEVAYVIIDLVSYPLV